MSKPTERCRSCGVSADTELAKAMERLVRCKHCHDENGWTASGQVIADALARENGQAATEWAYAQALVRLHGR